MSKMTESDSQRYKTLGNAVTVQVIRSYNAEHQGRDVL